MSKSIPKMLAAASLSLTLAMTGVMASSTQAEADNPNLRRFIAGAAGIAIIGGILSNQHGHRNSFGHGNVYVNRNFGHGTGHVIHPPIQHRLIAPSHCYTRFNGPNGHWQAFGAHCMHSNTHRAQLPSSCRHTIHTYNGWRQVYDANCLYSHGWSRS